MINTIGIIGALLLIVKIILHAILMSNTDKKFWIRALSPYSVARLRSIFPMLSPVPKKLQGLKIIVNILFFVAVILIVIYLIGVNK